MDQPGTRYMRALELLAEGRYREGFALYGARWECSGLTLSRPLPFMRRWQGEDLTGKRLLIWPEQGLGDAIMMARFAPMVAQSATVTLAARAGLARLFSTLPGVSIRALGESFSFQVSDFDYVATDFEVAAHFLVSAGLGREPPYLAAAPHAYSGGERFGVVTRGNPAHPNDRNRSLPADLAAELLALPGAISLHPEDTGAADFQETAELMAGLDRIISVDTSAAHLAGAMGKPVAILLPALETDWRWGRAGAKTPWYPSATLYRQPAAGDWRSPLDAILQGWLPRTGQALRKAQDGR